MFSKQAPQKTTQKAPVNSTQGGPEKSHQNPQKLPGPRTLEKEAPVPQLSKKDLIYLQHMRQMDEPANIQESVLKIKNYNKKNLRKIGKIAKMQNTFVNLKFKKPMGQIEFKKKLNVTTIMPTAQELNDMMERKIKKEEERKDRILDLILLLSSSLENCNWMSFPIFKIARNMKDEKRFLSIISRIYKKYNQFENMQDMLPIVRLTNKEFVKNNISKLPFYEELLITLQQYTDQLTVEGEIERNQTNLLILKKENIIQRVYKVKNKKWLEQKMESTNDIEEMIDMFTCEEMESVYLNGSRYEDCEMIASFNIMKQAVEHIILKIDDKDGKVKDDNELHQIITEYNEDEVDKQYNIIVERERVKSKLTTFHLDIKNNYKIISLQKIVQLGQISYKSYTHQYLTKGIKKDSRRNITNYKVYFRNYHSNFTVNSTITNDELIKLNYIYAIENSVPMLMKMGLTYFSSLISNTKRKFFEEKLLLYNSLQKDLAINFKSTSRSSMLYWGDLSLIQELKYQENHISTRGKMDNKYTNVEFIKIMKKFDISTIPAEFSLEKYDDFDKYQQSIDTPYNHQQEVDDVVERMTNTGMGW